MKQKKTLAIILAALAILLAALSTVFFLLYRPEYKNATAAYDKAFAKYSLAYGAYLEDKDTYLEAEDRRALQQEDGENIVYIDIRGYGVLAVKLDPTAAPITVANFKKLAAEGFYDWLTFHRVIDGFMIQGGDPSGDGTGGSADKIKGEFTDNGVTNPLRHLPGTISMARASSYNSASSQFFIVQGEYEDVSYLDGQYAAFGKVTIGMEVVNKIASVATDDNDMPNTPVYIRTIALNREDVLTIKEPTAPEKVKALDYLLLPILLSVLMLAAAAGAAPLFILHAKEEGARKAERLAESEENRRAILEASRQRKQGKKK